MSTIAPNPTRFAALLKRAIAQIHAQENIPKRVIADELGYVAGRQGSTAIDYWCRGGGHIPDQETVQALVRAISDRKGLNEADLLSFVQSAGYVISTAAESVQVITPPELLIVHEVRSTAAQVREDTSPSPVLQRPPRISKQIWVLAFCGFIVIGAIAFEAWRTTNTINGVSPGQAVSLKQIAGKAIVVRTANQEFTSGGTILANEFFSASFVLINSGIEPVSLTTLVISAHGPGVSCSEPPEQRWRKGGDWPLKPALNVQLQPGEEFAYVASRSLLMPGNYFLEPTLENPKGQWHGITPFTCIDIVVR